MKRIVGSKGVAPTIGDWNLALSSEFVPLDLWRWVSIDNAWDDHIGRVLAKHTILHCTSVHLWFFYIKAT